MKSIVQEASTIAKAIEQGWKLAGEPREFSIKVLEAPTHNFFGFTTRSAKVAIVFQEQQQARQATPSGRERAREPRRDERERSRDARDLKRDDRERERDGERGERGECGPGCAHTRQQPSARPSAPSGRGERSSEPRSVEPRRIAPQHRAEQQPSTEQQPVQAQQTPQSQERFAALWNDEIIAFAKTWLTDVLGLMGYADRPFTIEAQQFHLRVTFEKALPLDEMREKHVFASMATLLLAATKKTFRRALRGHKIVITHADVAE